jgi:hypothetical protein
MIKHCQFPECGLPVSHIFHGPCNPGKPNQCQFPHGGVACHVYVPTTEGEKDAK